MPADAFGVDDETPVRALLAQPHLRNADQARAIQHVGWPACATAELKPMQRGSATGFQIRRIPHAHKLRDAVAESKPRDEPRRASAIGRKV